MIVIGNIVSKRGDLRFKAGKCLQFQRKLMIDSRQCPGRIANRAIMFGQALQRFPAEIEPIKSRIAPLKLGQHAERLRIMIKPAMIRQSRFERIFSGMAKWRMADIMGEADGFSKIFVKAKDARDLEQRGLCQRRSISVTLSDQRGSSVDPHRIGH